MKTTTAGQIVYGVVFSSLAFLGVLVSATSADAATVFFDNFEDGNTSGWLAGTSTGIGSTGVELHNSSQMAFVNQTGSGVHSLSKDFGYLASETLSFDMHAVSIRCANTATSTCYSSSGVNMSFLDAFNTSLGDVTLINDTNPAPLGPNEISIDGVQHNYEALLSDYAAQAGLGAMDPISKLSLSFFVTGQTNFFGAQSNATVWFDNVTIGDSSVVPVPAAVWLFGSGLLGLVGIARRRVK